MHYEVINFVIFVVTPEFNTVERIKLWNRKATVILTLNLNIV